MGLIVSDLNENSLRELAKELVADIAALDPPRSREFLSSFLFEIANAVAEQSQKEERRKKQAEGIAAAQARGVRFGRPSPPLPDSFDQFHRAWREGTMTLRQAADACGMRKSTFENAALRKEQAAACTG